MSDLAETIDVAPSSRQSNIQLYPDAARDRHSSSGSDGIVIEDEEEQDRGDDTQKDGDESEGYLLINGLCSNATHIQERYKILSFNM